MGYKFESLAEKNCLKFGSCFVQTKFTRVPIMYNVQFYPLEVQVSFLREMQSINSVKTIQ